MPDLSQTGYIAVGSNIDPETNILVALEALAARARITGISIFYRTPAIDRSDQADYLNGVVRVESNTTAREFKFDVLRVIEKSLGRTRRADKSAPRAIDLDLVLWGNETIDAPGLRIPDPDIRQRPFVAIPLHELDPDLVLSDTQEDIASVIAGMDTTGLQSEPEFTTKLRTRLKAEEE